MTTLMNTRASMPYRTRVPVGVLWGFAWVVGSIESNDQKLNIFFFRHNPFLKRYNFQLAFPLFGPGARRHVPGVLAGPVLMGGLTQLLCVLLSLVLL
jgi:hypothetical protein